MHDRRTGRFYVDGFAGRRKLVQRSNLRMQEFASNCYFRALNTSSHPFLQGNCNVISAGTKCVSYKMRRLGCGAGNNFQTAGKIYPPSRPGADKRSFHTFEK